MSGHDTSDQTTRVQSGATERARRVHERCWLTVGGRAEHARRRQCAELAERNVRHGAAVSQKR